MAYSYFEDQCNTLRKFLAANTFDYRPNAIQKLEKGNDSIFRRLMDRATAQARIIKARKGSKPQSSWQLPQTRRYKQSFFAPNSPLTQPDSTQTWKVEICRFDVPYGSFGVVKSFEQYLEQGGVVFSTSGNWGNPYPGVDLTWYFRLSDTDSLAMPWISASGPSAIPDLLPGNPYTDFADSDDVWFPAGSSSSANIHLIVPGGNVLRLFAIVGTSQEAVTISAKLAGTTQIETGPDAQFVARTSW